MGLQKRLERMERIYEKKEQIMKSQMHALKDESYIRSQLEKDALLLHKVDLRYARNGKAAQTSVELAPNPLVINELQKALKTSDEPLPALRPKSTPGAKFINHESLTADEQTTEFEIIEG